MLHVQDAARCVLHRSDIEFNGSLRADRAGAAQWRGDVMGHSKRHVLERTVLPIVLASNAVAKVALDFQEQLKLANM